MSKKLLNIIAIILTVTMVTGQCSTAAFADTLDTGSDPAVIQEDPQETESQKEESSEPSEPSEESSQEVKQSQDNTNTESSEVTVSSDTSACENVAEGEVPEEVMKAAEAEIEKDTTTAIDNSTSIADGTYTPTTFTVTGGEDGVTVSCNEIEISGGKATAVIDFSKMTYANLEASATQYKGSKNTTKSVMSFEIPVALGKTNKVIAEDQTSEGSQYYTYEITIGLTVNSNALTAGTWKVKAETDNRMFYIQPDSSDSKTYASLVVASDGTMKATITLTGQGYEYLYVGTAAQAAKASTSSLSKYTAKNGYYSYTITVPSLDKKFTVAAYGSRGKKWYEHTVVFYKTGAVKLEDGASLVPTTKKSSSSSSSSSSSNKSSSSSSSSSTKVSSYTDDSNKSTSSVNNSTSLKDGTYTPKGFSWSGGSGRLSYIKCTKVIVKSGKVYGVIVFGSSSYDKLKANGKIYSNSNSGGNSTFVIPVTLNANNTIIGRTTAMSSPHWVKYTIYISLPVSSASSSSSTTGSSSATAAETSSKASTDKLSNTAPEIMGLTYKSTVKIKHAKLFKIFKYNDGITLVQIDATKGTALYQTTKKTSSKTTEKKAATKTKTTAISFFEKIKEKLTGKTTKKTSSTKTASSEKTEAATSSNGKQYDDEGHLITTNAHTATLKLYKNNVINYLLVPEGVDVPAGLDKKYIIVHIPADKTAVFSKDAKGFMTSLDTYNYIIENHTKHLNNIDYKSVIKNNANLCILTSSVLPKKVSKKLKGEKRKKLIKTNQTKRKLLTAVETRFTALDIPVMIDRSSNESTTLAKKEWIKVYGALYGQQKQSIKIFNSYVKQQEQAN